MSEKKFKSLLFSDCLEEPVVELGRITHKNSGISVYLPKSVGRALNLTKEDKYLVIFSAGNNGLFLIKNTILANSIKPSILDLREKLLALEKKNVSVLADNKPKDIKDIRS